MALAVLQRLQAKDYLTLANAAAGLIAIISALLAFTLAPFFFILAAVFFDFMDGKIARKTRKADDFGKQLDSLADVVSFAVAPAVLVIVFSFHDAIAVLAGIIYVCAGLLRLASYNLQKEQGVYFGLPIPLAALFVALVFYASYYSFVPSYFSWLALLTASVLMLSRFPLKKL